MAIGYVKPWTGQFGILFADDDRAFGGWWRRPCFGVRARRAGDRTSHGQNLFASMVQLTRRNTRRYGGYIVHFGVIVIMIGFAGSAFNQDIERELTPGAEHVDRAIHADDAL